MAVDEIAEEEEPVDWDTLMNRLRKLIYNQPDIIFNILEVLLEMLVERKILLEEEVKEIIKMGLKRWRQ